MPENSSVQAGKLSTRASVDPTRRRYQKYLYGLLAVLVVSVGAVAVTVIQTQRQQQDYIQRLVDSYERVEMLNAIMTALIDAETGERGFVISGQQAFLAPYYEAVPRLQALLTRFQSYARRQPALERTARGIRDNAMRALTQIQRVITARRDVGFDAARDLVATQSVKREMDALRARIAGALQDERERLEAMATATRRAGTLVQWVMISGVLLGAAVLALALWLMRREYVRRTVLQTSLERSGDELREAMTRADSLLSGREQLRRFSDQLQGCRDLEEVETVVAQGLQRVVPVPAGALCLLNRSRVYVEAACEWGQESPTVAVFQPENCFSLRRGRSHWRLRPGDELPCRHLTTAESTPTVCYPLSAHNETLGVLVLAGEQLASAAGDRDLMAFAAESISVTLAHLRLQDTLQQQALKDELTGLYNRRHMEASLERELARARRSQGQIAVIMADIDHFKRFNDTYGHDAADAVLASVAHTLGAQTRAEDIACRYGGEEFLIVVPGIDWQNVMKRAEQMRASVEQLLPQFRGRALGSVTLSAGIAVYPDHGDSPETLVHAADAALYRAKRQGRNQVCVAESAVDGQAGG